MRTARHRLLLGAAFLLLLPPLLQPLTAQAAPGTQAAADAIARLLKSPATAFRLSLLPRVGDADRYEVTAAAGKVTIKGTTPATILAGFNAYLGTVLHQSVSWNGSSLRVPKRWPDTPLLSATATVPHRFINNDVEDGYSGAYRTVDEWRALIDIYAMHGLNEVFLPVGTEAVYLDLFRQFGYREADLLAWIPAPAHQPWWLLQNMSGGAVPISAATITARAAVGRQVADYLRRMGMVPVLPGYFGTVPPEFASRNNGAVTIPQGNWVGGYSRPDWLDPTQPLFGRVARAFYAASLARLGPSTMYKMDILHEGGRPGAVNVRAAATAVETALQAAHPGATWVLLGWQNNPPAKAIEGMNRSTTFIVDGLSDRYRGKNRESDWKGIPYAFGTIWNFGGHTTIGSQLTVQNDRFFKALHKSGSALRGIAILPEGGSNNPAAFEFFAALAWRGEPVDLKQWFGDFAERRYGVVDPKAAAAWEILRRTAYDLPDDNEWSEAASGLYAATPSLTAASASSWAPRTQRYDMALFATALPALLEAAPATQQSATYRYDLMDLSRQVMSNLSRQLLPQLRNAYESGKCREFVNLSNLWLANIELTDRIAGTDPQQLLGRWLKSTRDFARTDADRIALERDQRSIISLWTPGLTDLNDYANREWNGLLGGYYAARWSSYFDSLTIQLTGHGKGGAPDWDAMGRAFVAGTASYEPAGGYATRPAGDVVALARTVVERAALVNSSKAATTPVPGPAAEQRTARSGCGPK